MAEKETRAEEVRRERRYKPGAVATEGYRLTHDESALDRKNYEYRWANDDAYRIQALERKDWDIAPEAAAVNGNGLGTVSSHLAGKDQTGKPYNAVLMRKRKEWFEEDHKRKMAPLDEQEKTLRAGQGANAEGQPGFYTPGVNNIEPPRR